jgi:hypothetical protein
LQRPRRDDLALVGRQAAEQRREREEDEAADEKPAAAEQIGHPAAEQQKAAERQHVGIDDPRQIVLRELQVLADRRQRDVDDRGVEHDDELRYRKQRERDPLATLGQLGVFHGWRSEGFRVNMKVGSVCRRDYTEG